MNLFVTPLPLGLCYTYISDLLFVCVCVCVCTCV
jgi:hypothetical protein